MIGKKCPTLAPNVLYSKKEKIHPVYVSKRNSKCKNMATF